jgi:hypothetical protein
MQAASRPYVLAAAALVATGAVIATPVLAHQIPLTVRSIETKLIDAGDIGNIPGNLFNDILNIPYNELEGGGLATVANSFLFTGTWWVPSSSNIWGVDPGDPTHIALIDNFIPFSAFTEGFTNANGVYEPGLNYEFAGLLAAELPVSSSCDAESCAPMTPPEVITGNTGYDRDIGFIETLLGQGKDASGEPSTLFTHFFTVPLQDLINGYTFGSDSPGIVDPSGPVNDQWAQLLGWGSSSNPFEGGGNPFEGGTGAGDTMPWDGTTYHLNLLQPFVTLYDSLTQDSTAATGVQDLTAAGVSHTFENLLAGYLIDFDPFTAGSPACPAECDIAAGNQIPALVADIAKMDPSNTTLAEWVSNYNDPALGPASVNEPTVDQINASIALLQTGTYNFSPEQLAEVDQALYNINPELPALYTNAGIITDPNYLAYVSDPTTTTPLVGEYGGYNYWLEGTDFLKVLEAAGSNPVDPTLSADLQTLFTNFTFPGDPAALAAVFGESAAATPGAAVDPGVLDPSFSADLSTLLAGLGTTVTSDAVSAALAEISAQITADLATIVPQSLLSLF